MNTKRIPIDENREYLNRNKISSMHHPMEGMDSLSGFIREGKYLASRSAYRWAKLFHPSVIINGMAYSYFHHRYNMTWLSERCVEISFAKKALEKNRWPKILEIGNVFSHYFPSSHDVIDKYEKGPHVRNIDADNFNDPERYDLIFSISTFEHMGYDEESKDPEKPLRVFNHLFHTNLAHAGTFLMTVPLGHNPHLDDQIANRAYRFSDEIYLKRKSKYNQWEQVSYPEVKSARYNSPFPFANALLIGMRLKAPEPT